MAEHHARISWKSAGDFPKGRYSREHTWTFDGGATVAASSSPAVVPAPLSNPANVDPEAAFVASLSSCHMLTFLYEAMRKKLVVASYVDEAVGTMSKNAEGVPWISKVVLRPRITWGGDGPHLTSVPVLATAEDSTGRQHHRRHDARHYEDMFHPMVGTGDGDIVLKRPPGRRRLPGRLRDRLRCGA